MRAEILVRLNKINKSFTIVILFFRTLATHKHTYNFQRSNWFWSRRLMFTEFMRSIGLQSLCASFIEFDACVCVDLLVVAYRAIEIQLIFEPEKNKKKCDYYEHRAWYSGNFEALSLREPVHPLTSMKFICFFHDSHIFHGLAFNKHYSHNFSVENYEWEQ